MRIGQNPAKFVKDVAKPSRVTVAVLNYIPFLSGYYADMLNVLHACLTGIWENTDSEYDLMVFDNGSCEEVIGYLRDAQVAGKIQYLILSREKSWQGRCLEYDPVPVLRVRSLRILITTAGSPKGGSANR